MAVSSSEPFEPDLIQHGNLLTKALQMAPGGEGFCNEPGFLGGARQPVGQV